MSNKAPNINLPKGGGAVKGMGEKFSPDLFTGTGNFSVPIAVPPGRNGLQPELTLGYSTGNGNGPFGLGWQLSVPGVTRKTSKGIPVYDDEQDVFILSGAEDLVPVARYERTVGGVVGQVTQYRPRTEGLFARIEHYKFVDGRDYWKVWSKDGLISYYGEPLLAVPASANAAVLTNPAYPTHIFAWHLTRTEDPFGNHILYEYEQEEGRTGPHFYNQLYLKAIRYADYDGTDYQARVELVYADTRPDPFSVYDAGFEIRTRRRCVQIKTSVMTDDGPLDVKSVSFSYADQDLYRLPAAPALNGVSLLRRVYVMAQDPEGTEEELPPLDFTYSRFAPDLQRFFPVEGADLPAYPLSNPDLELVDLTGNGLPDVLQLNGVARYWKNLGGGRFDRPRMMREAPAGLQLADPNVQMIDADGDGRADLLVNRDGLAGYFALNHDGTWDQRSFQKYAARPTFSFEDPEVKLLDLDGDGITDVLRNGSRLELFYNHRERGFYRTQVVGREISELPDISFRDPRLRLAKPCAGLQSFVLVQRNSIAYWPNLGRGRWGKKIVMRNCPRLPDGFNPQRVILGDVDGDGLDDLLYVENNRVTLWLNQSGNAWSEPIVITGTPAVTDTDSVRLTDLLGTGVAGLLWTRPADGRSPWAYFLDFTGRVKPYVLTAMDNNMGAVTRVQYVSSTELWAEDEKRPETRWRTPLPFPVQVVRRVEVYDLIAGGKQTTEYRYRHGYWDGGEREFRGFGRVDQRDTERFERYHDARPFADPHPGAAADAVTFNAVEREFFSPPMETRTWFYLGPVGPEYGDWRELDLRDEYWTGDAPLFERPTAFQDLLRRLPRRHRRDALRALRGTTLRTELYALDGSALQNRPYTVTESQSSVAQVLVKREPEIVPVAADPPAPATTLPIYPVQLSFDGNYTSDTTRTWLPTPLADDRPIFFAHGVAQRTTQWERGTDPMTQVSFSTGYTPYGQATQQLSLALRRGWQRDQPVGASPATPPDPQQSFATLSETAYAGLLPGSNGGHNAYDDATRYLVDRVASTTSYEVPTEGLAQALFAFRDVAFAGTLTRKLIGHAISYYDGPAYEGEDYGVLGQYGALTRSETLILTDALLDAAYRQAPATEPQHPEPVYADPAGPLAFNRAVADAAEYPADFLQYFDETYPTTDPVYRLGYRYVATAFPSEGGLTTGYYQQTERRCYDWQQNPNGPKRGLIVATMDPLGKVGANGPTRISTVEYDSYGLFPTQVTDALGHVTQAIYDYRVGQPWMVVDPNGNRTMYGYSPLGLLRETALIGKAGAGEGDIISEGSRGRPTYAPSTWLNYDLMNFFSNRKPVYVRTTRRVEHYAVNPDSATLVQVEFSDGFGRLLQTRAQAEDIIFGDLTAGGDSGLPASVSYRNSDDNNVGTAPVTAQELATIQALIDKLAGQPASAELAEAEPQQLAGLLVKLFAASWIESLNPPLPTNIVKLVGELRAKLLDGYNFGVLEDAAKLTSKYDLIALAQAQLGSTSPSGPLTSAEWTAFFSLEEQLKKSSITEPGALQLAGLLQRLLDAKWLNSLQPPLAEILQVELAQARESLLAAVKEIGATHDGHDSTVSGVLLEALREAVTDFLKYVQEPYGIQPTTGNTGSSGSSAGTAPVTAQELAFIQQLTAKMDTSELTGTEPQQLANLLAKLFTASWLESLTPPLSNKNVDALAELRAVLLDNYNLEALAEAAKAAIHFNLIQRAQTQVGDTSPTGPLTSAEWTQFYALRGKQQKDRLDDEEVRAFANLLSRLLAPKWLDGLFPALTADEWEAATKWRDYLLGAEGEKLREAVDEAYDFFVAHLKERIGQEEPDPIASNGPAVGTKREDSVIVSGAQRYDNKGRVVRKWEPFFSTGLEEYEVDAGHGQFVTQYYDARGRVYKTVNPDLTQQRVVYGVPADLTAPDQFAPTPWETYTYDANDLALLAPGSDTAAAAAVPVGHCYTPQSSEIDALGRTIRTTDRLAQQRVDNAGKLQWVEMQYEYDIRGNRTRVVDPYGRVVFRYWYDLRPTTGEGEEQKGANALRTAHIDSGHRVAIYDAAGQVVEARDARQAVLLTQYDALGRPTRVWGRDQQLSYPGGPPAEIHLRQRFIYGAANDDPTLNIRGRLVEQWDGGGILFLPEYDFKGNLRRKQRRVWSAYTIAKTWSTTAPGLPAGFEAGGFDIGQGNLDDRTYETETWYDALNRPQQVRLPGVQNLAEPHYLLPTYNRAGAMEKIRLCRDEQGSDVVSSVEQIAYNARGQRLLLALGNGIMTRYAYDPVSFRLLRQRTEGYEQPDERTYAPRPGTTRQDTTYAYDLAGNIVGQHEYAPESGVGGSDDLERTFSYDALYRLLTATGRETAPADPLVSPWDDQTRPVDPTLSVAYTQAYTYDLLGNIKVLQQTGAGAFTRTFGYGPNYAQPGGSNLLLSVQVGSGSPVAYTYDAAGNQLTENGSRHFRWDVFGRLRLFANWTGGPAAPTLVGRYGYDAGGDRVLKVRQTSMLTYTVTVYIDGVFEHTYEVTNNSPGEQQVQYHLLDGTSRLARARVGAAMDDPAPDMVYHVTDHLGSVGVQLDGNGTLVSREEYYPFGETAFGSYGKKRYRYCGKERDEESGLYYYGARYYAPWVCRFVSVDPLAEEYSFYTPYQYAGNKPINAIDLDGMEEQPGTSGQAADSAAATNQTSSIDTVSNSTSIDTLTVSGLPSKAPVDPGQEAGTKEKIYKAATLPEVRVTGSKELAALLKDDANFEEYIKTGEITGKKREASPNNGNTTAQNPVGYKTVWPVDTIFKGQRVTIAQGLYYKSGKYHGAADISFIGLKGARVFATHSGTVEYSRVLDGDGGNWVGIQGAGGYTIYMHLKDAPLVKVGQRVERGTLLGYVGSTSTTKIRPHLHYEIGTGRISDDPKKRHEVNPIVGNPKQVEQSDRSTRLKNPLNVFLR